MRIIGIVTEYNPFHNGHEYQLQKAREQYHADYIIVLMTGNFNQRGMPSIISKETRAHFAIQAGADIVLEFPTTYSLEDAPKFAFFAVSMLNRLTVITDMLFSSELGNLDHLKRMSEIVISKDYTEIFESLQEISASSRRREMTFEKLGYHEYAKVVNDPNNLFAIYFIATIMQLNSLIEPVTIKRIGNGYLDPHIESYDSKKIYASATAVRKSLERYEKTNAVIPLDISCAVPTFVFDKLSDEWLNTFPITREDFWIDIKCAIEKSNISQIALISGMNKEFAFSVKEFVNLSNSYTELIEKLREKHEYINFHRRLFRLLTKQYQADVDEYIDADPPLYTNVLAYSIKGMKLMDMLSKRGIIQNGCFFNNYDSKESVLTKRLADNTKYADKLYARIIKRKFGGLS